MDCLDWRELDRTSPDEQWLVLATRYLDERVGPQGRIALSGLLELGPLEARFGEIRHAVERSCSS